MRLRQLDALRGIAAMTVVTLHCIQTRIDTKRHLPEFPHAFWVGLQCLHPLFAGHEAVLLFFVLSGFVLSGAIVRRPKLAYPGYVLHRICRIYLPYLSALFFAISACALFHSRLPHWTFWMSQMWQEAPNAASIAKHLLFMGTYPQRFNYVFWSLIVELRVSLLLPLLVWILLRFSMLTGFLCIGVLCTVDAVVLPWMTAHASSIGLDMYTTTHYTLYFAIGALLNLHAEELGRAYLRFSVWLRVAVLLSSFITMDYLEPIISNLTHSDGEFVGVIGAAGIVFCVIHERKFAQALSHRPLLWLGDISFSLYLYHLPIIFSMSALLGQRMPYALLAVLSVALSLLFAHVFERGVEAPSRKLGKWLDKRYLLATG